MRTFGEVVFEGSTTWTGVSFAGGKPGIPRLGVPTTNFQSATFADGVPSEVDEFTGSTIPAGVVKKD